MQSGEHHRLRGELPAGYKFHLREIWFKSMVRVSVGQHVGTIVVLLVAFFMGILLFYYLSTVRLFHL